MEQPGNFQPSLRIFFISNSKHLDQHTVRADYRYYYYRRNTIMMLILPWVQHCYASQLM